MEYKQIQELIKTINKSNISELSIEEGDFKIVIKQELTFNQQNASTQLLPKPIPVPQQSAVSSKPASAHVDALATPPAQSAITGKISIIMSPMDGIFYQSDKSGGLPFVNIGDEIEKGSKLCIIEAMKLFNEIESDFNGRIVDVLAVDGFFVAKDQPLFKLDLSNDGQ